MGATQPAGMRATGAITPGPGIPFTIDYGLGVTALPSLR